jgi:ABC-type uncharacterized transport system auxiliary subunit
MKNILIKLLWMTGVLLLSGCAFKSATLRTFTLNPSYHFGKVSHSPYRQKSIKVAYPNSIKGKSSSSICFSYSRLEEGNYQNASWSSSSSQLLTGSIIRALEHGGVFKSVIDYTSLANTDYLLESEVYEICHKVRKGLSVSVLSMRFDLIDTDNNVLVKSRKFTYEIPTKTVDAAGYVVATNRAMEKLSIDLVRWLAQ